MARMMIGFVLGAGFGYLVGALLGCIVLMPASNLCGLGGAIIGLPVGGIVGTLIARRSLRGGLERTPRSGVRGGED